MTRGERGFTLLELLVALAVASLLFASATGIVRVASRSWSAVAARHQYVERLVRMDRTLRRQLAATIPAGALGGVRGRPPLFFGAADGFGWVARTPSEAAGPGLFGQRVRVSGDALVLESWPFERPDDIDTAPLGEPGRYEFAYFGASLPNAPPAWVGRWPAGPVPPRLVRVRERTSRWDVVVPVG